MNVFCALRDRSCRAWPGRSRGGAPRRRRSGGSRCCMPESPESTVAHRLGGVHNQGLHVDHLVDAETVALRARPVGGVEREVARLQLVDGVAVNRARQRERVLEQLTRPFTLLHHPDLYVAVGKLGGAFDRLGDAAQGVLAHGDPVHDDLDGVLELLVELYGLVVEAAHLAVDPHAREALAAQVFEELGKLPLAPPHDRGEHKGASAGRSGHNLVGHLVGRLLLDDAAALRAVGDADARKEETQVVVESRSRCPPWTGGSWTWSSGRWTRRETGRRCCRRRACPSGQGTCAHSSTATPRSGAAPPRRSCRTPTSFFRSPKGP